MCSRCSVAGDLYTLQAKAAAPPAGVPPLLEALQLNKLDVHTRVPDATQQFSSKWMHVVREATMVIHWLYQGFLKHNKLLLRWLQGQGHLVNKQHCTWCLMYGMQLHVIAHRA